MKQFAFPLETVLNYKNQVLDSLMNEHAVILGEIRNQELLIKALKEQYEEYGNTLTSQAQQGISVIDIFTYHNYLDVLAYRIKKEQEVLTVLKKKEEIKRGQVVESRKESASIEKLREKKLGAYRQAVQKEEERLIEEFVSFVRSRNAM